MSDEDWSAAWYCRGCHEWLEDACPKEGHVSVPHARPDLALLDYLDSINEKLCRLVNR